MKIIKYFFTIILTITLQGCLRQQNKVSLEDINNFCDRYAMLLTADPDLNEFYSALYRKFDGIRDTTSSLDLNMINLQLRSSYVLVLSKARATNICVDGLLKLVKRGQLKKK